MAPLATVSVTSVDAPAHVCVLPVTESAFPVRPPETTDTFAEPLDSKSLVPFSKPVSKNSVGVNGVAVAVSVGVDVTVSVGVDVTVSVGVDVTVSVGVDVTVSVGLPVGVAVAISVGLPVGVAPEPPVCDCDAVVFPPCAPVLSLFVLTAVTFTLHFKDFHFFPVFTLQIRVVFPFFP